MWLSLEKLRYKNLLSSGNQWTELHFNVSKKTLITGLNGAGKSTVIDALCLALFNRPFRKNVTRARLLNSITNRHLMIELLFSVGDSHYLIRRGIKPNVFEIYKDGELIPPPADLKDHQRWLEGHVLRMNFRAFTQIVVLGSRNYVPFMQLDAADRRAVIEDLLSIKIFSVMNGLLKSKIDTNKRDVENSERDILAIESQIELNRKRLESFRESNAKLVGEKQLELTNIDSRLSEIGQEGLVMTDQLKDTQQALTKHLQFREQEAAVNDELSKLEWKKENVEKAKRFLDSNDICPSCMQKIEPDYKEEHSLKYDEELIYINERLSDLRRSKRGFSTLNDQATQMQTTVNNLQLKLNEGTHNAKLMLWQADRLRKEIESLANESTAPDDITLDLERQKEHVLLMRDEVLKAQKMLTVAGTLLKDDGVKAKVVEQYMPWFNATVNQYLEALDLFITFELDEEFKENIRSRGRDEFVYENFSEGEKLRLDLALLFAWRDLAKKQNSTASNLLIFDEVLDSSLDNDGVTDLLKIVDSLTEKENVFVISHRGDTLSDKFSRTINFVKTLNFSHIEGAQDD